MAKIFSFIIHQQKGFSKNISDHLYGKKIHSSLDAVLDREVSDAEEISIPISDILFDHPDAVERFCISVNTRRRPYS